jgi:hypothetical protein
VAQFRCFQCKKVSAYKHRAGLERFEMFTRKNFSENERRTYECEHCRTENEFEKLATEWLAIDLGVSLR